MTQASKNDAANDNTGETLITFPCDFPIKIFGKKHEDFYHEVLQIIRAAVPNFSEENLSSKASKEGNYLALNALVHLENEVQLEKIRNDLKNHHLVLMSL